MFFKISAKISLLFILVLSLIFQLSACASNNATDTLYIDKIVKNINWNSTEEDIQKQFKDFSPEITEEKSESGLETTKKLIYKDVEILNEKVSSLMFIFSSLTYKETKYDIGLYQISFEYDGNKEYIDKINTKLLDKTFKEELKDAKESFSSTDGKFIQKTKGFSDYSKIEQQQIDKHMAILNEAYADYDPPIAPTKEEYMKEYLISINHISIIEEDTYKTGFTFNASKYKFLQALK